MTGRPQQDYGHRGAALGYNEVRDAGRAGSQLQPLAYQIGLVYAADRLLLDYAHS